jgi:phage shock protein C
MTHNEGLHRSRRNRVLLGVAGGFAEYFGMDPVVMRVIFVLLVLVTGGTALIVYLLLAFVMPNENGFEDEGGLADTEGAAYERHRHARRRSATLATLLIVIGVAALLINLKLLWWLDWGVLWPVVLIAIGAVLAYAGMRRN